MNFDDISSDSPVHVPDCKFVTWLDLAKNIKKLGLSCFSINIRSISGKFGELVAHLNAIGKKFTFILITETWLRDDTDVGFNIKGYKSVSLNRNNRNGGGLKLFFDDSISVTILENLTGNNGSCERLFVRSYVPGIGNIVLGGIYRPPDKPIAEFF